MRDSLNQLDQIYSLVVRDERGQDVEVAEIRCANPETALRVVERYYAGRAVQIVENDRPLARVCMIPGSGYWIVDNNGGPRPVPAAFCATGRTAGAAIAAGALARQIAGKGRPPRGPAQAACSR